MQFNLPEVSPAELNNLLTPSLLIDADRVRSNIDRMIETAGGVERLRPHCKTHKMAAVVRILLEKGIVRHKAATIAEVEMLFDAGVTDAVFAYNPVGPNIARVIELRRRFPETKLSVTADHPSPLKQLSDAAAEAGVNVGVMLDVNVGQDRTGIAANSEAAFSLYKEIHDLPSLNPTGFHVYDGHQHQESLDERRDAVLAQWPLVIALKDKCEAAGLPVPELVCGGTPTFPVYAAIDDPAVTLSPGTSIFHDAGYGGHFPDLKFSPAAVVVTRVISCPTSNRITLDLGNKSVAADPPKGQRVHFPEVPDGKQVIHNEEHLVLETELAPKFAPGDILLGIPTHICPTSALHQDVAVLEDGHIGSPWMVTARNRKLTI